MKFYLCYSGPTLRRMWRYIMYSYEPPIYSLIKKKVLEYRFICTHLLATILVLGTLSVGFSFTAIEVSVVLSSSISGGSGGNGSEMSSTLNYTLELSIHTLYLLTYILSQTVLFKFLSSYLLLQNDIHSR